MTRLKSRLDPAPPSRGSFYPGRPLPHAGAVMAAALALLGGCSEGRSPTESSPPMTRAQCIERAVFGDPAASPYCVPLATGAVTFLHQSYCSAPGRSHDTRFATDFGCDHGDDILAARAGRVEAVDEHWRDDDPQGGHENRVLIRQGDGTLAFYAHFQQQSIPVEVGDHVRRGQLIGQCGSSGEISGVPHLHFEVFESQAYDWDRGVPVNFRNIEGQLDSRNGLMVNQTYTVLPCS